MSQKRRDNLEEIKEFHINLFPIDRYSLFVLILYIGFLPKI